MRLPLQWRTRLTFPDKFPGDFSNKKRQNSQQWRIIIESVSKQTLYPVGLSLSLLVDDSVQKYGTNFGITPIARKFLFDSQKTAIVDEHWSLKSEQAQYLVYTEIGHCFERIAFLFYSRRCWQLHTKTPTWHFKILESKKVSELHKNCRRAFFVAKKAEYISWDQTRLQTTRK